MVKVSALGRERRPAAFVAVTTSVYRPGLSALLRENRPWKETRFVPA